jgi:hypothetical protein
VSFLVYYNFIFYIKKSYNYLNIQPNNKKRIDNRIATYLYVLVFSTGLLDVGKYGLMDMKFFSTKLKSITSTTLSLLRSSFNLSPEFQHYLQQALRHKCRLHDLR